MKNQIAWSVLRVSLAILIAVHGWTRLLGGGVEPFGTWLTTQGIPLGIIVAISVTAIEIIGTPLLAWGKLQFPITIILSSIYVAGIILVHAKEGWFVVGAGRNGVEYSVLLIIALLCVGLPKK